MPMKRLFFFLFATLFAWSTFAQDNMYLAEDAFYKSEYDSTIYYTSSGLQENPKDCRALFLRSAAYLYKEDYESALADINNAITYWKKKCGISLANFYSMRGLIYEDMKQPVDAYNDYCTAIKKDKKSALAYSYRAKLNFDLKRYAEALEDFRKAYSLDYTEPHNAVGMAECFYYMGEAGNAINILKNITHDYPTEADPWHSLALVYYNTNQFREAIDAEAEYLDREHESLNLLLEASLEEYTHALDVADNKMNNATRHEDIFFWLGVRARIHQVNSVFNESLKDLRQMQEYRTDSTPHPFIEFQSAYDWYSTYHYPEAAECYSRLIRINENEFPAEYYYYRANCYEFSAQYDLALADFNAIIEKEVSNEFKPSAYLHRGIIKEILHDYDGALEDYNSGLLRDLGSIDLHLFRGRLLLLQKHDTLNANNDFNFILEHDTTCEASVRAYALLYLGRDAEALEWHDGCMGDDPTPEELYTAACLYARMNKPFEAINSLLSSLNMGFRALDYLEHDDDLASLRNLDEYKEALEMYRALKAYEDTHFLLDDEIPEPDQD